MEFQKDQVVNKKRVPTIIPSCTPKNIYQYNKQLANSFFGPPILYIYKYIVLYIFVCIYTKYIVYVMFRLS